MWTQMPRAGLVFKGCHSYPDFVEIDSQEGSTSIQRHIRRACLGLTLLLLGSDLCKDGELSEELMQLFPNIDKSISGCVIGRSL